MPISVKLAATARLIAFVYPKGVFIKARDAAILLRAEVGDLRGIAFPAVFGN